ncbi:hypothetical protein EXU48_13240 [Occultella glacieicola]|uniref:Uncharacterized protein n=1 Tax=Occultella glacieicola TaxID=2518684 RepID=A0ABY2E203_9MICO|nr:hypothetical protein [Occultella glacieicola]TDE92516.1 hypothetical protein EXU48_13240 [Occultella glacieicola]
MLWFSVWTVLVLGTLVGAFLLGRRLWRSAKALMAQAGETSRVMADLSAKVAELEAAAGATRTFTPDLAATQEQRENWRARRAENLASRRARVQARRSRTLARWRSIGIPF